MYLVQLKADQADDERCSGRDSGNDLARDLLGRMPVSGVDAVVHRAQVRRSSDEVDVVVGVIILLELDGRQAVACER